MATPTDRSIGLGELAQRAQTGGTARARTSTCRNPECQNGLTPGLVAAGGGSKAAPLFGAGGIGAKRLMRWGWVPCLACSPTQDQKKAGARYKPLGLSDVQIAQRAELASRKAAYQQPTAESLGKLAPSNRAAARDGFGPGSADAGKFAELLEQNKQLNSRLDEMMKQNAEMTQAVSRMSMQVAALLEDNAKLRASQANVMPVIGEGKAL